ncbi:hypothetical protein IFR05_000113 [Cadophora sp. M221]|nr:hypothetical protein IFR05_000113 [Cadophora sp. M221]
MAQSKVNHKENVPPSSGKKGKKAAGPAQRNTNGNPFALIADDDGNAKNAKEFDAIPHTEDEAFFMVDEDLTGDEREVALDRVDLLNFIHKELFYSTIVRHIPATLDNVVNNIEYFHQAEYKGRKIDIGVHFYEAENGVMTARAFVKFADTEISNDEFGTTIYADHAANATEAKKDKGSKVVAGLTKFYWAPRWNFVVRYLRHRMEAYTRDGSHAIEIVDPALPTSEAVEDDNSPVADHPMEVPSGCTGAIIGKSGTMIKTLTSQSGAEDIKMPEKVEPRPKAHTPVILIIIGNSSAAEKAKVLIQAIVDEWRNAPRPSRDGGNGGSVGFQQPTQGFAQIAKGSGGNTADDGFGDAVGSSEWGEAVNDAVAAASQGGGSGADAW